MKVAIWDTYVPRKDGRTMHFDIVVPEHVQHEKIVHSFGQEYLFTKDQVGQPLTSKQCQFCHTEIASEEMEWNIAQKGYYIIEMEGCE